MKKNVKNIKSVKVKNYNLNLTEIRDSDFKNAFPGTVNFTVGILFGKRNAAFIPAMLNN